MSKDPTQVILRPVITEKSTGRREALREVCFAVPRDATKGDIKTAVERLFKVKVDSVRTQMKHGKERRVGRSSGRTKDWKKAIVRLKAGEKMIEYFEAV